jgi:beta-mannosidase
MKNLLVIAVFLITEQFIFAQNISTELNKNWQFKNQTERKWYKATVPGTVHTDLLANKLIPDPFYRDNESKLQWIDNADWEYRTIFNVDEKIFASNTARLNFKGLDTYADVYLNGHLILQADNMFREWIIPVEAYLKRSNNILLIRFSSAQRKADSIAKSRLPLILPDNNRVYVRKAQYHFLYPVAVQLKEAGQQNLLPTSFSKKIPSVLPFILKKMANPFMPKVQTGYRLTFFYPGLKKKIIAGCCKGPKMQI